MTHIERAAEILFPATGPQTLNVKFLCGGVENYSAEALAEQIVRAEVQILAGSARLMENIDQHLTPVEG